MKKNKATTPKKRSVQDSQKDLFLENQQLRMEIAYFKKLHALIQEKEKLQTKTKRK